MKIFIKLLNACLIILGCFFIGYSADKLFSWSAMFLGFGCMIVVLYLDDLTKDEEK